MVLAIDIGGSKLMMGCVDTAGEIREKITVALNPPVTAQGLTEMVRAGAGQLNGVKAGGLRAASVNIPGLADAENGVWVHAPYSGVGNFAVAAEFSEIFGLPVHIENDVNACALAEKRFGLCEAVEHYIWVTVSNGIGGSLVTDGRLYGGYVGNAGEIGHFIVEEDEEAAFLCGCGSRGCLEAMAAGPGIARLYGRLSGRQISPDMRSKEVGELARAGDADAVAAFEKAGHYIGKALSYAVNFVNPEAVVLGGGVMMDDALLMPPLERAFRRFFFRRANEGVRIVKTALGYDAALLGAAAVALAGLEN